MMLRSYAFVVALAAAPLLMSGIARADSTATAPASGALTYLKAKHEVVYKLLSGPETPDRDKKIDDELDGLVDYDEMTKAALDPAEIEKHKPEEIRRFRDLLQKLVEKNYKKRLKETLNYDIAYDSEVPTGDDVVVKTTAKHKSDARAEPVHLEYKLRPRKGAKAGSYIMIDLVAEGSSMVGTYRKEFAKVIKKDGWDALIKKMEDKLAKS